MQNVLETMLLSLSPASDIRWRDRRQPDPADRSAGTPERLPREAERQPRDGNRTVDLAQTLRDVLDDARSRAESKA